MLHARAVGGSCVHAACFRLRWLGAASSQADVGITTRVTAMAECVPMAAHKRPRFRAGTGAGI